MPYLEPLEKMHLDNLGADRLAYYCSLHDAPKVAGTLNYLCFKIIRHWIKRNSKKYWIFALFIGSMLCSILEVYRRLIAPYEDTKIRENGDID